MTDILKIEAVRGEEFPRQFCAEVNDFGDWTQLEPLYKKLAEAIAKVETPQQLNAWLVMRSEIEAGIDEEGSRRYIASTCATDNEEAEKAYLDFVVNVVPKLKPWDDRLDRLYLDCPVRKQAPGGRLAVLDRQVENLVKLFCEDNIPLETELTKLSQQYQKLCGAMMVKWRGEERTLQQMAPLQEETGRAVREESWRLVSARRLEDRDRLNELFDTALGLRNKIALNAGFENYRDYRHQELGRFDYKPSDCMIFHEAVEHTVAPLLERHRGVRRSKLGVDSLRPWDLGVDEDGRPPLKPFETTEQLEAGCETIFAKIAPELGAQFTEMRRRRLLDLDSRKGKAPGGYQCTLSEVRLPFIFMNAAGSNRDLFTLLHEGGHAFHAYAHREEPLLAYRGSPMEFAEVASMSMELIALDEIGVFYSDPDQARRARVKTLEDVVDILPWVAIVDAFQHWIHLNPGHSVEAREEKFIELEQRFSPGVDWSGLEAEQRSRWHRQLHLFEVPFYYIEYGIAQLGALQMWINYRNDPKTAIRNYRQALALGNSKPLPELFQAAGIKFDFSDATLQPIMAVLEAELSHESA